MIMVIYLQNPTIFLTDRKIISVSYSAYMALIMLGRQKGI